MLPSLVEHRKMDCISALQDQCRRLAEEGNKPFGQSLSESRMAVVTLDEEMWLIWLRGGCILICTCSQAGCQHCMTRLNRTIHVKTSRTHRKSMGRIIEPLFARTSDELILLRCRLAVPYHNASPHKQTSFTVAREALQ